MHAGAVGAGHGSGGSHAGSGGARAASCAARCDAAVRAGGVSPRAQDAVPDDATVAAPAEGDAQPSDGGTAVLDAAAGPARFTSRPITTPPVYLGSVDDGADCSTQYATLGFEPDDGAATRHPLFLYLVGTTFVAGDASSKHDSQAARAVTEAMARRGFVALSVEYDNSAVAWLSDHKNQLACLFDSARAGALIGAARGMPRVDCDLGIATWGHSQGGLIAVAAASFDSRVRAAWLTGYGGGAENTIAKNRLRVVNGEADTTNGTVAVLNQVAGFSDAECPDDGRGQCLRDDGSGWVIVRAQDVVVSSADHCWFDKASCLDSAEMLEPNWIDRASTKPFALEPNADWVARTARAP